MYILNKLKHLRLENEFTQNLILLLSVIWGFIQKDMYLSVLVSSVFAIMKFHSNIEGPFWTKISNKDLTKYIFTLLIIIGCVSILEILFVREKPLDHIFLLMCLISFFMIFIFELFALISLLIFKRRDFIGVIFWHTSFPLFLFLIFIFTISDSDKFASESYSVYSCLFVIFTYWCIHTICFLKDAKSQNYSLYEYGRMRIYYQYKIEGEFQGKLRKVMSKFLFSLILLFILYNLIHNERYDMGLYILIILLCVKYRKVTQK